VVCASLAIFWASVQCTHNLHNSNDEKRGRAPVKGENKGGKKNGNKSKYHRKSIGTAAIGKLCYPKNLTQLWKKRTGERVR